MPKLVLWNILLVGLGGFAGSVMRFAGSGLVQRLFPGTQFPAGTLAVNLVGCFLIGLIGGYLDSRHLMAPELRLVVISGVLGGLTTFSTFGYETFALGRGQAPGVALSNVLLSVILGLVAVWGGYRLSQLFVSTSP